MLWQQTEVFRYHVQFVYIVCVSVEVQAHFRHSDKQMIQERIQSCVEAIEPRTAEIITYRYT